MRSSVSKRKNDIRIKANAKRQRLVAMLLCVCVVISLTGLTPYKINPLDGQPTKNAIDRKADGSTMDDYIGKLLNDENGSRYAGRIWTDKTVFAYDDASHSIGLDEDTDGFNGSVDFNADFAHVFSALASSQIVNEYPPSPIDLVIALDMSASMAQSTTQPIGNDIISGKQQTMEERIETSRVQQTLDAVNKTIDELMTQNSNNRVAVVVYGAGATVLMPLSHYKKLEDDKPYLTVGGMETLYDPSDLKYENGNWYWQRNRDACYTIEVDAMRDDRDDPFNVGPSVDDDEFLNEEYKRTVSNNVDNDKVHANPGYAEQNGDMPYIADLKATKRLAADEYVGYFTNTQGGIYLAYRQLAKEAATTYTAVLSTGDSHTVARIPAAIIMTDGGANFAFNKMNFWMPEDGLKNTTDRSYYGDYRPWPSTELREHDGVQTKGYIEPWNADGFVRDQRHWNHEPEDAWHRLTDSTGSQVNGTGLDRLNPTDDNGRNEIRNNAGDEWYKVYLPGIDDENKIISLYNRGMEEEEGTLVSPPGWDNAGIFYSADADPFGTSGTSLQLLMTASYMKTVVNKHYQAGWDENNASDTGRYELSTYTMSVDSDKVPQWGRLRLYPTMDPAAFPLDSGSWWGDERLGPEAVENGLGYTKTLIYSGMQNAWNTWKGGSEAFGIMGNTQAYARISPIPEGDDYTLNEYGVNVTNEDVKNNIVYSDGFYDVASADIADKFKDILNKITGKVVVPVSGDNDAGVSNSVTYQDPIGEYMEIKNQAIIPSKTASRASDGSNGVYDMSLLLFGEMHGMVRTGVYDYNWNDKYMTKNGKQYDTFQMGWYKGDDPEGDVQGPYTGETPPDCATVEKAWENGWVYRLNYSTLLMYVPIVASEAGDGQNPQDASQQVKNTVYTVYRFADDKSVRNSLRINPVYGDNVPEDLLEKWKNAREDEKVDDRLYRNYDGVYRLSDIRVWAENTGDYIDTNGAITPEDNGGYDDSLYINVPAAAVPTQAAEITLGADGPIAYRTNLKDKRQSTPIRLFYAVGLTDDIIERDESGAETNVNISAISAEYVKEHTDPTDNHVWFLSNWYSNTAYTGYTTDEYSYRTRGDAAVSFSPSVDNRYYIFQKPLPLYAHAYRVTGGRLVPVDWTEGADDGKIDKSTGAGNGETTWENGESAASWSGGEFIGAYESEEAFKQAVRDAEGGKITDGKGYEYSFANGGEGNIVVLIGDQLSKVESDGDGNYTAGSKSFSSDDYFFICIEYYKPNSSKGMDINGNEVEGASGAEKISHVVARRGSDFGSGLQSENIDNGDMLCWTDINGSCPIEIEYNSRSTTGDNTRGRPTLEKLTYGEEKLREYLAGCGLDDTEEDADGKTALDRDVTYWLGVQANEKMAPVVEHLKEKPKDFETLFDWSVAARTGGIRAGTMRQFMAAKENNVTDTANNYYIPTISPTSGAGNDLVINNYLGNNGRLEVGNVTLQTTKRLTLPGGAELDDEQRAQDFQFQAYVQGVTGEREAIRLLYNQYSQTWQRRIAYIDVLTDNSSLLMDNGGRRALFDLGGSAGYTDPQTPDKEQFYAKLVVPVTGGDGEAAYYYADEDGTATSERYTGELSELYYFYLPPNDGEDIEDSGEASRRIFQDGEYDAADAVTPDGLNRNGRTTYYPEGTRKPTPSEPGERDNFREATAGREAGTRTYWALDAELIPVREVWEAEGMLNDIADANQAQPTIRLTALEAEQASSGWQHSGSAGGQEGHRHVYYYTLVINKPTGWTSENDFISPFKTRTMYMTKLLRFGLDDGQELFDKTPITLPGGVTALEAAVRRNTAQYTLKHGEGLLLTGLNENRVYRFTEMLDSALLDEGYTLKEAVHVTGEGSAYYRRPEEFTGVYSVSGTTAQFERQVHFVNEIPWGSIAVEKFGGEGELLTGAGFTLYEKGVGPDGGEVWTEVVPLEPDAPPGDPDQPNEKRTRLVYMVPLSLPNENYDAATHIFTDGGADYPVRKEVVNGEESLYYFKPQSAFDPPVWEALVKADPSRVRAVAEFKNLDVSKVYKLVETTVPEGYIITHQPEQEFTFKGEDGAKILHMLYEVKNFKPLDLPETGGTTAARLSALGASLALLGLALMRKRRRSPSP